MNVDRQIEAARTAALAVPAPQLATLVVTGADRKSWLNGLVTCDLAPLAPGQATYGLAVTTKGRVLADLIVVVDEARVVLAVPRDVVEQVRAAFDHYLVMEDAEMAPEVDGFAVTLAHGPRSLDLLAAARAAGAIGAPLDRTGLGGAVVLAPREAADRVAQAIAQVATLGDDAGWDALRIARGVPRFGADFGEATYPQEAGLEKSAVSFQKGCYLGQEVVCMLEMRGHVKRRLVPIAVDGAPPPVGAQVEDAAGAAIGEVTSVAEVPGRGVLALAMLKRAHTEPGGEVRVGGAAAKVIAPER